jgi:basic membrane protein A
MKGLRFGFALLVATALLVPGCASITVDCKQAGVFCVGLVTEVGRRDDRSYNQAAWEGLQQAKADGQANWIASIETVDARDYEDNIRVLAEAGYDVIVTVESGMSDATRLAAQDYPEIYFIGLDQDQSENQEYNPNLVGLVFPEDQIGFLAGALAASLSQTGQVGAVCASDGLPAMQKYGEGFQAGAAYVDPTGQATVIYHNDVGFDQTFDDPEWGAATANSLVDAGVDIVFGVGGTTGSNALVAAVARGAYAIGSDTDEYYALPVAAPHLYASVMKSIAPAIAELVKVAKGARVGEDVFPTGNFLGQVVLSPYHDTASTVPDEVKQRMDELNQALIAGEVQTGVSLPTP